MCLSLPCWAEGRGLGTSEGFSRDQRIKEDCGALNYLQDIFVEDRFPRKTEKQKAKIRFGLVTRFLNITCEISELCRLGYALGI